MPIFKIIDTDAACTPAFLAAWRTLSERARIANPFWDPDFCLPAIAVLAPGAIQLATLSDSGGALKALAPFSLNRTMMLGPKVAMLWTHDYIPLTSPLIDPDDDTAFETLISGIALASASPVIATHLKDYSRLGKISKNRLLSLIISEHSRAAIKSSQSGEEYRRTALSRQRRQGLERRLRRLKERTAHLGALEIELCTQPKAIAAELEAFLRLENASWKGQHKTALLSNANHAALARDAITRLAARNMASIATMKAGETLVASLLLCHLDRKVFSWKIAFDETYREYSPGAQLMARFMDSILNGQDHFELDSCTAPDNTIANALWGNREIIKTVIFASPQQSTRAHLIQRAEQIKHHAKRAARALIRI